MAINTLELVYFLTFYLCNEKTPVPDSEFEHLAGARL